MGTTPEQRVGTMNANNPLIVLRNWVAQVAIERAEAGEFELVRCQLSRRLTADGMRCVICRAGGRYTGVWSQHAPALLQLACLVSNMWFVSGVQPTAGRKSRPC